MSILLPFSAPSQLKSVIRTISPECAAMQWLVTDLEYNLLYLDDKEPEEALHQEGSVAELSGTELVRILTERELQIFWGVFCGFASEVPDLSAEELPWADGNAALWTHPQEFQVKSAEIEIVCWDSTDLLLKFKNESLAKRVLEQMPEGKVF